MKDKDPCDFYAAHGPMTDPGGHRALLDRLPTDTASPCRVVQGLMIHIFWAERYGVNLPAERKDEVQLRSVAKKLARINEMDNRPLAEARMPGNRLAGNCRDFSVMLTAILRHQGVPARARCGFARYFLPNRFEDHWVCEYWRADQGRWVLVDAQLDEFQRGVLSIAFDPLDVPRSQFIPGGEAWRLCRLGQADPETFGIFDMHGLWFVRGNLVRDVAALNKMELLPWDAWGIIEARDEDLSPGDLSFLDRAAELTSGDVPALDQVRELYEKDRRLRVPAAIRSHTQAGVKTIDLCSA